MDDRQKILSVNDRQASFYETPNEARARNVAMNTWRFFRRRLYATLDAGGIRGDAQELHRSWIGDLSEKKVLDLGCYEGNHLSLYLAEHSADYLGIDLSASALDRLRQAFERRGLTKPRLRCVDFLSPDFDEGDFDLIYAQGVLHHFDPIEALLPVLDAKLAPGGRIVAYDPLRTSLLTNTVRTLYHPFRSDRDWEFPFRRETLRLLAERFELVHVQGFLGASKWAVPLAFLDRGFAGRLAQRLHRRDLDRASRLGPALWGCLQVATCFRKRER
jgi:SAM-dependent methyltransferase